jgi:type VI secretion system ImpH/TssG family protein
MIDATALPAIAVLRRLRREHPEAAQLGGLDPGRERLRLRPSLGLTFAAGEVEEVREAEGVTEVVLALPALYGPGSPLPAFATEALMGGGSERSRGLIDLLNHRILSLTLLVAGRRELETTAARAERIAGLAGLASAPARLRWAGLLRSPRSAADLELMLADLCDPMPARIGANRRSWERLAAEAWTRLGRHGALGVDAVAGDAVETRATAFTLSIGPLASADVRDFTPGGARFAAIAEAVAWFDGDGLDWTLELLVADASLPPAALGGCAALARSAPLDGMHAAEHRIAIDVMDPMQSASIALSPSTLV